MWIDRQMADPVLAAARQFPALVLTGGRQTGDDPLLEQVVKRISGGAFRAARLQMGYNSPRRTERMSKKSITKVTKLLLSRETMVCLDDPSLGKFGVRSACSLGCPH
jgi:predicted alpha/beta-hydrolase family hydrolase